MVLKYSASFDLLTKLKDNRPASPDDVQHCAVAALHGALGVRSWLPDRKEMQALAKVPSAVLQGANDLAVRWAAEIDGESLQRWAMRVEHPSRDDAGLLWTLDLCCKPRANGPVTIGFRLDVIALDGSARPFGIRLTRPSLVPTFLHTFDASRNGIPLAAKFHGWRTLPRLRNLLADPSRELPIVLMGPYPSLGQQDASTLARIISRQLAGCALLAVVPTLRELESLNAGLDKSLQLPGPETTCVYWPLSRGMRKEQVSQLRESHASPMTPEEATTSAQALLESIVERVVVNDYGNILSLERLLHANASREAAARENSTRAAVSAQEKKVKALTEENDDFQEQITELTTQLAEARSDLSRMMAERTKERAKSPWREWKPTSLESVLTIVQAEPTIGSRIILSAEAWKGASKSPYESPEKALDAIAFLAETLLDAKRKGNLANIEAFATEHGREIAATESKVTKENAKWMDERKVKIGGEWLECRMHYKLGSGGPRNCCRIYFTFHGEGNAAKVVVGHVGEHLTTRMTADQ